MTESVVRSHSSNAGVALNALMKPSLKDEIVLVSISASDDQNLEERRETRSSPFEDNKTFPSVPLVRKSPNLIHASNEQMYSYDRISSVTFSRS